MIISRVGLNYIVRRESYPCDTLTLANPVHIYTFRYFHITGFYMEVVRFMYEGNGTASATILLVRAIDTCT